MDSDHLEASVERLKTTTTLPEMDLDRKLRLGLEFGLTLDEAERHLERAFPRPHVSRLRELNADRNRLTITTKVVAMGKSTPPRPASGVCTDGDHEMPLIVWGSREVAPGSVIRIVGARTKVYNGKLQLEIPEAASVTVLPSMPTETAAPGSGENVLFVCTGNTCRSPMAELLLNHFGERRFAAYSERARGGKGGMVAPGAKDVLVRAGVPRERIQSATVPATGSFDRIVVMDEPLSTENLNELKKRRPGDIHHWEVADPIGGDYVACYRRLQELFKKDFGIELPSLS